MVKLNDEQQAAVDVTDKHSLVLAGAGTGKTTTLVARAERLLKENVEPRSLVLLTFTRRAAREMQERLVAKVGESGEKVFAGTFHAFALYWMKKGGLGDATILDRDDSVSLMQLARAEVVGKSREFPKASVLVEYYSYSRNTLMDFVEYAQANTELTSTEIKQATQIVNDYQARKLTHNYLDFDDILKLFADRLHEDEAFCELVQSRISHLLVDELQDTNPIQWHIVYALLPGVHLFCVGDDAQCHLPGTKILMEGKGVKNIEDVVEGDRVVGYYNAKSRFVGLRTQGKSVEKIASFDYDGDIIEFATDQDKLTCTPNHRCYVRLDKDARKRHALYLMIRGTRARIGVCALEYHSKHFRGMGPLARARTEKADAVWVLDTFDDLIAAQTMETVVSAKFGLPQLVFERSSKACRPQEDLDKAYDLMGDLTESAIQCLEHFGRRFEYPLWQPGKHHGKFGNRGYVTQACNVFTGNQMKVFDPSKRSGNWQFVTINRRSHKGKVYGLQVEKTQGGRRLYVANNIVTHNSVYAFRGADFRNVHSFKERVQGGQVLKLEANYRSTQEILDFSNWLLNEGSVDYNKNLYSGLARHGDLPEVRNFWDAYGEAEFVVQDVRKSVASGVPWSEHMVIMRSGHDGRVLEGLLAEAGIKYRFIGGMSVFQAAHVKDLLAMLRVVQNHRDELAWMRYLTLFPGVGEVTASRLVAEMSQASDLTGALQVISDVKGVEFAKKVMAPQLLSLSGLLFDTPAAVSSASQHLTGTLQARYKDSWEKRRNDFTLLTQLAQRHNSIADFLEKFTLDPLAPGDDDNGNVLTLITGHSSKGTEADVCYVLSANPGRFPHKRSLGSAEAMEEERRLLYVACTRARNRLVICRHANRGFDMSDVPYFLAELPSELVISHGTDYFNQQANGFNSSLWY